MATIGLQSSSSSSLTLYIYDLDTSYQYSDRSVDWFYDDYSLYPNANYISYGTSYLGAGVYSGGSITISGLLGNHTYRIQATVVCPSIMQTYVFTADFSTAKVRPAKFTWLYTKNAGNSFNLYAAEWNALTTNINAVRVYKGYSEYPFSTVISGNTFTSVQYNQCVAALNDMGYGGNIAYVSKYDNICASALNALASTVNSIV